MGCYSPDVRLFLMGLVFPGSLPAARLSTALALTTGAVLAKPPFLRHSTTPFLFRFYVL